MLEDALQQTGRPANEKGAHVGRRASLSPRREESFPEKGRRRERHRFRRRRADRPGPENDRRVLTLVARARQSMAMRITIPATALAQAVRNPARQARLSRLIRQVGTDLIPLDGPDATAVGILLARTGTADIADAHVVICAQRAGQAVVTSDPDDLSGIAPELRLVVV